MVENSIKLAIQLAVALPIHVLWLYAGASLKRLDLAPGTARMINYGMAAALIAVVILALLAN